MKQLRDRYVSMGGVVEVILKPGCDHHPHSLEQPEAVVDFIKRYQSGEAKYRHIVRRGTLANAFSKFERERKEWLPSWAAPLPRCGDGTT